MPRYGAKRIYVCNGGALGNLELPEVATDRAPEPAERLLTPEVLTGLMALVAALAGEGQEASITVAREISCPRPYSTARRGAWA